MGTQWKQWQTLFSWAPKITADSNCSHEIKRCLLLERKVMTKLESMLKSRGITMLTKGPFSQSYGFSSSQVWMWSKTIKKAEQQGIDAFELWCWRKDCWESLGLQEIQPVHPKGNQPWIVIGGTDTEAKTPILWPHDAKSWLTGKDPDAGKD